MIILRKTAFSFMALTVAFLLTACGNNIDTSNDIENDALNDLSADNKPENSVDDYRNGTINPYLSITARRMKPDTDAYIWDEVYYTYDLETGMLQEVCILPHLSGYTAGVVSLRENAVYFSMREEMGSNDQICRYDLSSGEMIFLEDMNASYNDIAILDDSTLLVIASTRARTIMPAHFDLNNNTFTYMSEVNGEPLNLHTMGAQLLSYNYLFDSFPILYHKLTDIYSEAYMEKDEPIDYNFTMVASDLKISENVITVQFSVPNQLAYVTQVNENEVLAMITEVGWDDSIPGFVYAETYYYLTFGDEGISFVEIDNPFPGATYVTQCLTFDGGKTYFCRGGYILQNIIYDDSLFLYNSESGKITPILTPGVDDILSVANMRSVG